MRASLSFVCLAALTLSACDGDLGVDALSAENELLLTALSGEEESLSRSDDGDSAYGDPMGDDAGGDRPPLMRECDAEGTYTGLFSDYDADASGDFSEEERGEVEEARDGRDQHEQMRRVFAFTIIHRIYDADDDQELSDSEKETLFADFSERCEVLHDRLVDEFDADGDGELSEDELQTAGDTLKERHEERREECESESPMADEASSGEPPSEGMGEGPPGGEGEPPDPRDMVDQLLLEDFDSNGDGEWSDDELAEMQAELRARVVSGEHLAPMGPPPPPPAE